MSEDIPPKPPKPKKEDIKRVPPKEEQRTDLPPKAPVPILEIEKTSIETKTPEEVSTLEEEVQLEPSTVTADQIGKINFTKEDIKKLANFLVKQNDNPTSE